MVTLEIRDESTTGETLRSTTVELQTESLTVEELIRSYVFQRVKDSNVRRAESASDLPLVELTEEEISLNGIKSTKPEYLDWQSEFTAVKTAFRRNAVLVFVDELQMNCLETVVTIRPSTAVKFLRLTMLMGG